MTIAEIVVGIMGLIIGITLGMLITPRPPRLKPCQKCGNRYPGLIAQETSELSGERYWVVCLMCDEECEDCDSEEEAIREWNRQ